MKALVTELDEVTQNIALLNESLEEWPRLADRLGTAHAFYVLEGADRQPLFGFSKFVGYSGIEPEYYLDNYKNLDGRNTEHALKPFFEELTYGTPVYNEYFSQLAAWMRKFGKTPRQGEAQKLRIMVLKSEYQDKTNLAGKDDDLLNLLIAVAAKLPAHQKLALKQAI